MSSNICTLAEIDTQFNADSVEWCPLNPEYFVCGTYQLIEGNCGKENELKSSEKNSRVGSILLFNYQSSTRSVLEIQKISTAAVTDMKWCSHPVSGKTVLAITSSAGDITLYSLIEKDGVCNLEKLGTFDVCSPSLSLSLDWSKIATAKMDSDTVVVSDSSGSVSELRLSGSGNSFELIRRWKAHNFDAWITAYDYWNTSTVYSGGDDCTLKGWDTRTGCYKPVFVNKSHTMGVCSIQSNPHIENVFVSGSYDEQIHVWDSRSMKEPLTSCDVGGGVWRLKWHPIKPDYLLAASCHSGFHVVQLDFNKKPAGLEIIGSYTAHKSLAYGADWGRHTSQFNISENADSLHEILATCSFYDHSLHLWEMTYSKQNC